MRVGLKYAYKVYSSILFSKNLPGIPSGDIMIKHDWLICFTLQYTYLILTLMCNTSTYVMLYVTTLSLLENLS